MTLARAQVTCAAGVLLTPGPGRIAMLLALLVLITATACGSSESEQVAERSLSSAIRTEYAPIDAEDAACVASVWVDDIGLDALERDGVLRSDHALAMPIREVALPENDAIAATDAFNTCTDLADLTADLVSSRLRANPKQAACIHDAIDDRAATRWVQNDLAGRRADRVYVIGGRGCMSTPAKDARAVAALATRLGHNPGMTPTQAECVATGLVEQIGVHELTATGVLDRQQQPVRPGMPTLSPTDANLGATAMAKCVSIDDMLSMQELGAASGEDGPAAMACLRAAFDGDNFHAYLVATLTHQNPTLDRRSADTLATCLQDAVGSAS